MPDGTGLNKFSEVYPDRYFDTAIAEQHAVCFAAGLAAEGMKPITAIYSTFLQRAYDMIAARRRHPEPARHLLPGSRRAGR